MRWTQRVSDRVTCGSLSPTAHSLSICLVDGRTEPSTVTHVSARGKVVQVRSDRAAFAGSGAAAVRWCDARCRADVAVSWGRRAPGEQQISELRGTG